MIVRYDRWHAAWGAFRARLEVLIDETDARRLVDVGGGANPVLPPGVLEERGLECTIVDASAEELEKAPDGYRKVVADVGAEQLALEGGYDLAFSRMVAEHVRSPERFHRNVRGLLRPGGRALHFFPTLYAPAFVVNRLLPEGVAEAILRRFQTGREREGSHGRFRAYYRWCRGPSKRQVRRLEPLGYEVEEYWGFFGHSGYFERVPGLRRLDDWIASGLVRRPVPALTSYAFVLLRRDGAEEEATSPSGTT